MAKQRRGSTLPKQREGSRPPVSPPPAPAGGPISRRMLIGVVAVAVVAVIGLVAAGAAFRGNDDSPPVSAGAVSGAPQNGKIKGNPNAPVTIVEYADFQCPACGQYAKTIAQDIDEAYVKTGVVKVEFRHYAFLGKESQRAAEASECAAEQGRFWDYHTALFNAQRGENRGAFSDDRLKAIANGMGFDSAAFTTCFDSGRYTERVKASTEEGKAQGVNSTPTFFINNQKVVGVGPFDSYKRVIDAAAGGAR